MAPPAHSTNHDHTLIDPTTPNSLPDRQQRREIHREPIDTAKIAARLAKQESRRAESEAATLESARAKQVGYAHQQKKRQLEIKQERERILRSINNDKLERKYREELHKESLEVEKADNDDAKGLTEAQRGSEISPPKPIVSEVCAIQVRLLDGSTIRSKFPSQYTLRAHVRPWVDMSRTDDDIPYTFRQVLIPFSNRPVSISEEEQPMQSLGFTPSATLIMVPVQGYTRAYTMETGYVNNSLAAGYSAVSGGISWMSGALATFLGIGTSNARSVENRHITQLHVRGTNMEPASNINVHTLSDQQIRRDPHQLYNGNQASLLLPKMTPILMQRS